jgi:hypothetical protein
MNVTVRNIITSMRLLSTLDWRDFFESVSLVEQVLQREAHRLLTVELHHRRPLVNPNSAREGHASQAPCKKRRLHRRRPRLEGRSSTWSVSALEAGPGGEREP